MVVGRLESINLSLSPYRLGEGRERERIGQRIEKGRIWTEMSRYRGERERERGGGGGKKRTKGERVEEGR